jgi:hypothetical protein
MLGRQSMYLLSGLTNGRTERGQYNMPIRHILQGIKMVVIFHSTPASCPWNFLLRFGFVSGGFPALGKRWPGVGCGLLLKYSICNACKLKQTSAILYKFHTCIKCIYK